MCLLAILYRAVPGVPIVLGANREEAYARGGTPPQLVDIAMPSDPQGGSVRALAGLDPRFQGTWLGVNQYGLVVGLTNRPKSEVPADPRSRGLLTRDLLGFDNAHDALQHAIRELTQRVYAGCNLLLVHPDQAFVVHAGDWLRVRPLPPGLHVLAARDINDVSDHRVAYALDWLHDHSHGDAQQIARDLQDLCGQRGSDHPPMCIRSEKGGTVSSTILALAPTWQRSTLLHAQGPPDVTPFADLSILLRSLDVPAQRLASKGQ